MTAGGSAFVKFVGLQLAKGLNLFPSSSKVNPLGSPEERSRLSTRKRTDALAGRAAVESQATCTANENLLDWTLVPEYVVEKVFRLLKADVLQSDVKRSLPLPGEIVKDQKMLLAHSLAGVCQTWRRVSHYIFLTDWWHHGRIVHPVHCLLLTPKVFPSLLRCFVERQETVHGRRFILYQGERSQREACKFLMAADLGRFSTTLYFSKKENSKPCARMESNFMCTSYSLDFYAYLHMLGSRQMEWAGSSLASVEYRTRLQGCMRPRRMRVSIPGTNVLQETSPAPFLPLDQMLVQRSLLDPNTVASSSENRDDSSSLATMAFPPGQMSVRGLPAIHNTLGKSVAILSRQGKKMQLENKTPHWNETLKCWCLNFRGRVKFASVKNFQLVDVNETDEIVMQLADIVKASMPELNTSGPHSLPNLRGSCCLQALASAQLPMKPELHCALQIDVRNITQILPTPPPPFGKVAPDTYILDFQPASISVAQAFAVSLSAFNRGLCP